MSYIKVPEQIEEKSFDIIRSIIQEDYPDYSFKNSLEEKVILRCIHTSADFDWLEILKFSENGLSEIVNALKKGATIYTDTNMALSGMNKRKLDQLGCSYFCYVADEAIKTWAEEKGITRSMAAVEYAVQQSGEKIFVFGNAPTALFKLLELTESGECAPYPVIGVPVGFVGAAESKDALMQSQLSYITAEGRKGGSNIAAAIMNAILYGI